MNFHGIRPQPPFEGGGPLISIITVVYNNRDGFERTANSIFQQDCLCWEWIVIDGGSTDGTADLIRAHAPSIAYWVSERDGGIFDAMNKGIARASGEFLVFMNSGDRFAAPDTLGHVSRAIAAAEPDVGMVIGDARYEVSPTFSYVQAARPLDPYVYHSLPSSHQAMFFRTSLHRQVPFDPSFRIAADYDAIARMFMINRRTVHVPHVVALVWRGLESNSQRSPFENIVDMALVQRRVLGLGYPRIAASAVKRALPVIAFRLMANRWTRGATSRLIALLRPDTAGGADASKTGGLA